MKGYRYRDLSLVDLHSGEKLVIACDSSAGIGEKEDDMVKIAPSIMAAYSLRVPLMELFCFKAKPIAVIDTIGNEMTPTGKKIILGIKQELVKAGLTNLPLNGSTEDNMVTQTTSLGVTVIGVIASSSDTGALFDEQLSVYQLGTPYVGEMVKKHLSDIFSYDLVKKIRLDPAVLDMLPVGSKGIKYETNQMALSHQLKITPIGNWDAPEFSQSAGPATVILIGVKKQQARNFHSRYPQLKLIACLDR